VLRLLTALALGTRILNACPNLPLQVATQAVLLHQVPALPDGAYQVTVTQAAQILGRAQILARLAVHVAGIGRRLLRRLRLLRLLAALALGTPS
jgi:hypothetical protein